MTEEQAKTMWCPASRSHFDAFHGENITNMPNSNANTCAGSLCMAWRWFPQLWEHQYETGKVVDTKERNGYGRAGKKLPHEGYCGLAGKP